MYFSLQGSHGGLYGHGTVMAVWDSINLDVFIIEGEHFFSLNELLTCGNWYNSLGLGVYKS
jgi:hypothetical protein